MIKYYGHLFDSIRNLNAVKPFPPARHLKVSKGFIQVRRKDPKPLRKEARTFSSWFEVCNARSVGVPIAEFCLVRGTIPAGNSEVVEKVCFVEPAILSKSQRYNYIRCRQKTSFTGSFSDNASRIPLYGDIDAFIM